MHRNSTPFIAYSGSGDRLELMITRRLATEHRTEAFVGLQVGLWVGVVYILPGVVACMQAMERFSFFFFFFFNDPAPPEISPLPLHAALPISKSRAARAGRRAGWRRCRRPRARLARRE